MTSRLFSLSSYCCMCVVLFGLLALPGARADSYYDQGLKQYGKRNFKAAADSFSQSARNSPSDGKAFYYQALAYSQLGDWPRAKEAYRQVYQRFPGTQAAALAAAALARLDPNFLRQSSAGSTSASAAGGSVQNYSSQPGSSSDTSNLPNEVKVYFTKDDHNKLIVDAYLNSRPLKMMFDTGATGCHLTRGQLESLGMRMPAGPPTGQSQGVGGYVSTWDMPARIRVGPIERQLSITVQEGDFGAEPLLGEDFFNAFEYEIDQAGHCIHFRKKARTAGVNTGGKDLYSIPFRTGGNIGAELEVQIEVRGRRCPIFFDTGAQTSQITRSNLRALGLEVPADAQDVAIGGVGGQSSGKRFELDEVRVGPVVKTHFPITVVDGGVGLLGQDFFSDWRFTIDNQNRVIKVFH